MTFLMDIAELTVVLNDMVSDKLIVKTQAYSNF